jgi:hypothetical protein
MNTVISTTTILKTIPPASNQLYKMVKSLKQKNENISHNINPIK